MGCLSHSDECSVFFPIFEMIIDGIFERKIVREKIPLDASSISAQNGVDAFPHVDGNFLSVFSGRRQQGADQVPLVVAQIGFVCFA